MGNPAVFDFSFPDGSQHYHLRWADPLYQVAKIGEWVAETLLAGAELTLLNWESWMTDHYVDEHGIVRMQRTEVNPRRDVHGTHDADHRYRLTANAATVTFTDDRFDRYKGWRQEIQCESVEELLAAGVDQARRFRRRARILRRQRKLGIDQLSWIAPISFATDRIRLCEQRAERYTRAFSAST